MRLVFALGLARFAGVLRMRWPALLLIAVCVPFSIIMDITFAHALERVLIVWALAAQADQRRSPGAGACHRRGAGQAEYGIRIWLPTAGFHRSSTVEGL